MFKKILVPLDGSALAERALMPARQIAQHGGGELIYLRVPVAENIELPFAGDPASALGVGWLNTAPGETAIQAEDYLAQLQQAHAQHPVRQRAKVVVGDVAQVIADTARAEQVDLIVMSSHGYSGLTRWFLGSVAERVLPEAPCPVFVVRSEKPPRQMLIALDGSALAEQALGPGLTIAASLGLPVTLVRAIPTVPQADIQRLNEVERGLGRRLEDELREDADTYLTAQVARARATWLDTEAMVIHEPAAEGLVRYAETHAMDVIAMSTHGRTGLQRWRYGSVTDKVLHGAGPCSMVIVRPVH